MGRWSRSAIRGAVSGVVGVVLAGCSLLPGVEPTPTDPSQLPPGAEVTLAPDAMRLELSNGSTLPVVLAVNRGTGLLVEAGGRAALGVGEIGPLPWDAVVLTEEGRVLLELVVRPGDVAVGNTGNGGSSSRGRGVRADLSCGRIDLWSGPRMMGPAPPESFEPGDCDP
jgi:hypothetical protein